MTEPMTPQSAQPVPPAQPAAPPSPLTAPVTDPRRKSPLLAAVLSFAPGIGQVYVGYYQRGFIHIAVVALLIMLLASDIAEPLYPPLAIFLGFFWLYNVVDAWRRATLYNQALVGQGVVELPSDLRVPGFQGTVVGGTLLALFGLVLLMNTRFDVSLDWVEEWWPAAFIVFGGYLVWKAMKEKSARDDSSGD